MHNGFIVIIVTDNWKPEVRNRQSQHHLISNETNLELSWGSLLKGGVNWFEVEEKRSLVSFFNVSQKNYVWISHENHLRGTQAISNKIFIAMAK